MFHFLPFAGTGRWSSPCTSLSFHRHRWLPSRFLQRTYKRPKPLAALLDLDATLRDAHSVREPETQGPLCSRLRPGSFRLSTVLVLRVVTWRDGLQPKLGVVTFHVRFLPLNPAASTPTISKDGFGTLIPLSASRSTLVVSHHFGGLLRSDSAGLLHPAAGHEVRHVSQFTRRSDESVGPRS